MQYTCKYSTAWALPHSWRNLESRFTFFNHPTDFSRKASTKPAFGNWTTFWELNSFSFFYFSFFLIWGNLFKWDSPTRLISYENVKIYKILTESFLIFRNRLDKLTYCRSVCMSTPPHLYRHRDLPLYLERLLWWPTNTEHNSKQYPYFIYLTMDMDLYYGSPLYLKSVSGSEWSERKLPSR